MSEKHDFWLACGLSGTSGNHAAMIAKVRGEHVYLLAATTADGMLPLKPQNLVTGLPFLGVEAVS